MAEPNQIIFAHKEVVEALLQRQGITKGIWGIYIKFGIGAANIGAGPSDSLPAAIVPVMEIGVQRFPELNNLSVDASKLTTTSRRRQVKKKPAKKRSRP